ncbi:DUF6660 family protein [Salegentibacter chungangensis]|uniref:DUF6660 family protein n=1 Tax=Salegentibacter chungangensis TaxID=1335724 RepID=A0ABW3NR73_9FLAO
MPCEDSINIETDTAEFHKVDTSGHNTSHTDDCSPFCQCHCCHVHYTNLENTQQELIGLEISKALPEKSDELGEGIPRSFFQPPRV